ncbi:glycosyltransferase [Burkholderia cenocepacia]|uniref:glycosyltransferase family 2 protein n=1 Tax=Burkholderia cenocepacia TaxID=95486 RepID=UPI002231644A|nr:glycosyltransferase [Burkholderia cenocepacia]MCW3657549.1 glycosyltransferase [Burkholderia cenocepacia]
MSKIHLPYEGSFAGQKRERVGVCIPSGDMVHADFAMSLAALAFTTRHPIALLNAKGSLVVTNRNTLVDQAAQLDCEWLLFLDSDLVFPRDTVARLIAHDKDIVGATYCKRVPPYEVLGRTLTGERLEAASGLVEVAGLPTGCLLVRRSVFDALCRPYFRTPAHEDGDVDGMPAHIEGEDYYFCRVAREAGFSVWLDVDLTMQLGHIGQQIFAIPTHEEVIADADGKIQLAH